MSSSEIWRPVVGYEGYYEVSDLGAIRSLERMVFAGPGRMRRSPSRILSIYTGDNYSKVRLKVDGVGQTKNVHSLVAEAFIGPRPSDFDVCHNNGNPHDNALSNLRYDSRSGNSLDRRRHGTAYSRRDRNECFKGHPYETDSFYIGEASGKRVCLICDRERHRMRVDRKHVKAGTVRRSERTICKDGHPLDGLSSRGKRFCKECQRQAGRKHRLKQKRA